MAEKENYGSVPHDVCRRRSSLEVYKTFLGEFNTATGARIVVLIGLLTSLGTGGLIGVVPKVAAQRFAEESFGLEEGLDCDDFDDNNKPLACVQGADHSQSMASYDALARNLLALLTNSIAGSHSDSHGRRGEAARHCSASLVLVSRERGAKTS